MTSKTNFINYFLLAFTLAFISSGLSAGTLDFKDKKKDKEKKEELTADGPYVLYQPDGQIRVINVCRTTRPVTPSRSPSHAAVRCRPLTSPLAKRAQRITENSKKAVARNVQQPFLL